ncbi:MAG: DUF2807 domain-containing protein [Coxiellaceae bacterium]|nr:DUF2807 domain-containing protein [Coxiellaceae bacterium]
MRKSLLIGALLVVSATAMAANKTVPLKSNFSQISAEDGFEVKVKCGDTNSATLSGPQTGIDSVSIMVSDGNLKISKSGRGSDKGVEVEVTTAGPLNSASIRDGVELEVKGCAVNKDAFTMNMEQGAKAELKGKTNKLNLNMKGGTTFGDDDSDDLIANTVNINAKMGSRAYVCGAKKVTGDISMGVMVYTGKDADTGGLSATRGAATSVCDS